MLIVSKYQVIPVAFGGVGTASNEQNTAKFCGKVL